MRWIVVGVILASRAMGQTGLADALGGVKTPEELQRIVAWWLEGGDMRTHSATWDNGVLLTGTMAQTFDRDTATFDVDHQTTEASAVAVGVDVPRYGGDIAVYSARTPELLIKIGRAHV